MINYKNPDVLFQDNSFGIDLAITKIQHKLTELSWLQKPFGRAIVQTEYLNVSQQGPVLKNPVDVRLKPLQIIYPEYYTPEGEPFNLMPNDNLQSYCFFVVRDPVVYIHPDPNDMQQIAQALVSLIFWADISKTEEIQNIRVNEKYKTNVLKILKSCQDVELKQSFDAHNAVFDLFTINETYRYYMKKPFIAFRFDFNLIFTVFPENVCI